MIKKIILCLLVVLAIGLVACGKDDGNDNNSVSGAPANNNVQNSSDNDVKTPDSGKADTAITETGKNEVGNDKNVTDGTTTKTSENTYNVGGIDFEIPDTFKKKDVFVGAQLVFESSKNQGIITMRYTPLSDLVRSIPEVEGYESVESYFVEFMNEMLETDKHDAERDASFSQTFSEFGEIEKEKINVAGYKAIRCSVNGKKLGDCYREGPVKNLVMANMESIQIYNDVDQILITVTSLCKEGKAEAVSKLVDEMLANASVAESNDNMQGHYGDSYIELGGFSFEIPEAYGMIADFGYFTESEDYIYYYGSQDVNNIWWTNINAQRIVLTKAEFEEESDDIVNSMFDSLGGFFMDIEITSKDKFEIDGMQALSFKATGKYDGVPTDCEILLVNNTKTRFGMFIYAFYPSGNEELANAYASLIGSMKLLK